MAASGWGRTTAGRSITTSHGESGIPEGLHESPKVYSIVYSPVNGSVYKYLLDFEPLDPVKYVMSAVFDGKVCATNLP